MTIKTRKYSWLYAALLLPMLSLLLCSCWNSVWTGANMVYQRHGLYRKLTDFQLAAAVSRALYYKDMTFKCVACGIDVAAFNRDILIAGHVPTAAMRQEIQMRIQKIGGYRRLLNELAVSSMEPYPVQDSWITTKIRSEIVKNAEIDPQQFKVVTSDGIVYLMGDVIPEQATLVVDIARGCMGVKRVVKLFKYYNLSNKPNIQSGNPGSAQN